MVGKVNRVSNVIPLQKDKLKKKQTKDDFKRMLSRPPDDIA